MTVSQWRINLLALTLCFLLGAGLIVAQETCPAPQQSAIASASASCAELMPGQVCYGAPSVTARGAETADVFTALAPGGLAELSALDGFAVSMGEDDANWGIAIAQFAAYIPDAWVSHPATLWLFGDAVVIDEGESDITREVRVAAREGANVRQRPATNAPIRSARFVDDVLKATGRLADNSWVRVLTRAGLTGWVFAPALNNVPAALPVVEPDQAFTGNAAGPLQAFSTYIRADAPCPDAPASGLLLQTPEDVTLAFQVNGLRLLVNGTAFIQAEPGLAMRVAALEGMTTLHWETVINAAIPGYELRVPLSELSDAETLTPAGPPSTMQVYAYDAMTRLPTLELPRPIYPAFVPETLIRPRPVPDASPLMDLTPEDDCRITVGPGGVNLRRGPGTDYPIGGAIGYRESATPIARAQGTDGQMWWKLANYIWLRVDTTVTGGNCISVPRLDPPPSPR